MVLSVIVLSILSLLQFILIFYLANIYLKIKKEKEEIEEEYVSITDILPGDNVRYASYLNYLKKDNFTAYIEAKVIEVSDKSVKVDPYDVSHFDNLPSELRSKSNYKKDIMDISRNNWIDKEKVELLLSKEEIRQRRIEKILGK
jgi:hypothetical protein